MATRRPARFLGYPILQRAVEEGLRMGLMRADKHADDPLTAEQRERVEEQCEREIMNALSEVVDFGDE